jgi:hypothetical protein
MSADDQGPTLINTAVGSSINAHADLSLPAVSSSETLRVEGTNVVRVPFGVRRPRRSRPARPERWATVVLPFVAGGNNPPPPQAA